MYLLKFKGGLKNLCCWILLLQLFNLSIDPARHQNFINGQFTFQEDLSINKIESIYELISEHIFKKDVPETQNSTNQSFAKAFIVFHQLPEPTSQLNFAEELVLHNHNYQVFIPELVKIIESPPPKV